jgi:hypothetical protein
MFARSSRALCSSLMSSYAHVAVSALYRQHWLGGWPFGAGGWHLTAVFACRRHFQQAVPAGSGQPPVVMAATTVRTRTQAAALVARDESSLPGDTPALAPAASDATEYEKKR